MKIGPYEILGELGRGGMGVVYRAVRPELNRQFALKIIRPDQAVTAEVVARFRREAQAASSLAGEPGIVAVHDVGEAQPDPSTVDPRPATGGPPTLYLAMDLIEGRPLDQVVASGDLGPMLAADYVEQAARAIARAHAHGVIHRDLKPANLLIAPDGRVFVTDFGLAAPVALDADAARLTRTGVVLGTPAYLAPEQLDDAAPDVRADVWSLGATLYECLAGTPPYGDDTPAAILGRLVREAPVPLARRAPDVPAGLAAIVAACLARDPGDRYPSATALADDLARVRRGERPLPPGRLLGGLRRSARRHRAALAVVSGAALVAGGIGLALAWHAQRERDARVAADQRTAAAARQARDALRHRAGLALDAALELRRRGELAGMRTFLAETEAACAEAATRLPRAPDPHYWRGRLARVCLRHADAVAAQEAALAADPDFAPARVERLLLRARTHADRVETLVAESQRTTGALVAGRADVQVALPDRRALAARDAEAAAIRRAMGADLARLLAAPPTACPPGDLACARGIVAAAEGREAEARRCLAEALAHAPDLVEAREALAAMEEAAKRWPEALAAWLAGREADAGYLPFRLGAARLRQVDALTIRTTGLDPLAQLTASAADLEFVAAALPEDDEVRHQLGGVRANLAHHHRVRGRDAEADALVAAALADFEHVLARRPERAATWLWLASVLANRGALRGMRGEPAAADLDAAERAFESVLRLAPDAAEAWFQRGGIRVNLATSRYDEPAEATRLLEAALGDFETALRLDPSHVTAWLWRGNARVNLGQMAARRGEDPAHHFAAAIEDYDAALRLGAPVVDVLPLRGQAWNSWGVTLWRRRGDADPKFRAALEDLDRAVAVAPDQPLIRRQRAVARHDWAGTRQDAGQGERALWQAALDDLETLERLDPRLVHDLQGRLRECRAALGPGR